MPAFPPDSPQVSPWGAGRTQGGRGVDAGWPSSQCLGPHSPDASGFRLSFWPPGWSLLAVCTCYSVCRRD